MIFDFLYIRLPQSQTKFKLTWAGPHGSFFSNFNLIILLAIRFCFRLAYYTILTVKIKQDTLKTIEASKSDQTQEM